MRPKMGRFLDKKNRLLDRTLFSIKYWPRPSETRSMLLLFVYIIDVSSWHVKRDFCFDAEVISVATDDFISVGCILFARTITYDMKFDVKICFQVNFHSKFHCFINRTVAFYKVKAVSFWFLNFLILDNTWHCLRCLSRLYIRICKKITAYSRVLYGFYLVNFVYFLVLFWI